MESWTIGRTSPGSVAEYLLAKADSAPVSVFCFDYFDTLIVRDIQPEFTKQLAARLHAQLLNSSVSPEELYSIRQELEKNLCQKNLETGGELEFYLTDFAPLYYRILQSKNVDALAFISEKSFTKSVLDIETAVELAVQRPCLETIELLKNLKKQKSVTILISDFYLPGTHFKKFLLHFDLYDLFDHVYISSDHRIAKGSGRLYKKICDDLDYCPEQLTMIGDNPHADVVMAKEQGARALHLKNPEREMFYSDWQPQTMKNAEQRVQRFASAIPVKGVFPEMASTVWLFTKRLFDELIQRNIHDVFFFSKEGQHLKRIFDQLQDEIYGNVRIRSHYILVSRKATFLASLRPLEQEDFSRLFSHYRDISLRDFLLSLNIEETVASNLCLELQLDFQLRVSDLQSSAEFQTLKQSEQFKREYERRREQQRSNFIHYLKSYNVDFYQDGLTIVDVGWKGSIQDNVYHILEGKVAMQGFFLGSLIATELKENNCKKGLLFDDRPEPTPFFQVYNNNRSLFEMMLGATHGSADGYFTREQYEQLPAGHQRAVEKTFFVNDEEICVTTLDFPEERKLYRERIEPLQKEGLKAAALLNNAYILSGCSAPDSTWFARQHARMVFKPDKIEVDFFEQLYHLENFGIFEYTNFLAGDQLTLKQRLKNMRNVIKNPSILESGFWPPIILRRLGLDLYRYVDGQKRFRRQFGGAGK